MIDYWQVKKNINRSLWTVAHSDICDDQLHYYYYYYYYYYYFLAMTHSHRVLRCQLLLTFAVVLPLVLAGASAESITPSVAVPLSVGDFTALRAGRTPQAPLLPEVGIWLVRFSLPWDSTATNPRAAAMLEQFRQRIPAEVIGIGELLLSDVDAMTLAELHGVTELPGYLVVSRAATRMPIPKGVNVAALAQHTATVLTKAQTESVDALWLAAGPLIPTTYADRWTQSVRHVAPVVRALPELREVVLNMTLHDATVATFTAFVFPGFRHAGAALQVATIMSAGAAVGNRGPPIVIIDASADGDFASLRPKAQKGAVSALTVDIADPAPTYVRGRKLTASSYRRVRDRATLLDPKFVHVESEIVNPAVLQSFVTNGAGKRHVQSVADALAQDASTLRHAHASIEAFLQLEATEGENAQGVPGGVGILRKLTSVNQFYAEVMEVKDVVVIFMLRETDRFFAKHLRIARELAKLARKSTQAVLQEQHVQMRYDVVMLDAEVHPGVGRALKLKTAPAIAFILPLQNGAKGLRLYPTDDVSNAALIDKFMRGELLDGKGTIILDPSEVRFTLSAPVHSDELTDVSLRTERYDLDPHRIFPEDVTVEAQLESVTKASSAHPVFKAAAEEEGGGPFGAAALATAAHKRDKSKMSPAELKRFEKEEKKLADLKDEVERKRRDKEERIRKKAEATKAQSEVDKVEAKKRLLEEKIRNKDKPKTAAAAPGSEDDKAAAKRKQPAASDDRPAWLRPRDPKDKKRRSKPVASPTELRKLWDAEQERAYKEFVIVDKEAGTIDVRDTM